MLLLAYRACEVSQDVHFALVQLVHDLHNRISFAHTGYQCHDDVSLMS